MAISREGELYERWQNGSLSPEERGEVWRLLGVGSEGSNQARDRYIITSIDPWSAAATWADRVVRDRATTREPNSTSETSQRRPASPAPEALTSRRDRSVRDRIAHIREALGPRGERLERFSPSLFRNLSQDALRDIVDRHRAAIEQFPAEETEELRQMESARTAAVQRRYEAERAIAGLRARRSELSLWSLRSRGQLTWRIQQQKKVSRRVEKALRAYERREADMLESGRHPDSWVATHGPDAEYGVAASQAHKIQARIEALVAHPTRDPVMRDLLGERGAEPAARESWDDLARRVVQFQVEYEIDVDRDGPLGPELSGDDVRRTQEREELVRDITKRQFGHGMDPASRGVELDEVTRDALRRRSREAETTLDTPSPPGREPLVFDENVEASDPIKRIRHALGPQADRLERYSPSLFEGLPRGAVRDIADRHQAAIDQFPAAEAWEVRRLEKQHQVAEAEWGAALQAISNHKGTEVELDAHHRDLGRAAEKLERIAVRKDEIRASGRDPARWVETHGVDASYGAAARQALAIDDKVKEGRVPAARDAPEHSPNHRAEPGLEAVSAADGVGADLAA